MHPSVPYQRGNMFFSKRLASNFFYTQKPYQYLMRFNALIRTHHITSRKKVVLLKKAAERLSCDVLLRSGGAPGIMYCEGSEDDVRRWVTAVQVFSTVMRVS